MCKILTCLLLCFAISACQDGPSLGPGSDSTLASASQEDCGFVQNVYGQRVSWKKQLPIRLYISKDFPSDYEDIIRSAARKWEDAAGMTLFEITAQSDLVAPAAKDGHNGILWDTNWTKSQSMQAVTSLYWSKNQITETDLSVDARYYKFFIDQPDDVSELHLQSLLIHELGHVLGLKHRSVPPTVMWPILNSATKRDELTDSDRKSLKCEY